MLALKKLIVFIIITTFVRESAVMESNTGYNAGESTYLQAHNDCVRAGKWLPTTEFMPAHNRLIALMKENGWDTTWLRIKKTVSESNTHKWLDGVTFEETLSGPDYKGPPKECGILETVYGKIDDAVCHEKHGFICTLDNCSSCNYLSPYECARLGDVCYLVSDTVSSWFAAKNICENKNGQLAVIHSKEDRRRLSKLIQKHHKDNQDKFFIGFRRIEFYYDVNGGRSEVQVYHWYVDEPSNMGECTVLQRFEEGYFWKSADCNEKHYHTCTEEGFEKDHTVAPTATSETRPYSSSLISTTMLSLVELTYLRDDISEVLHRTGKTCQTWHMVLLILPLSLVVFVAVVGFAVHRMLSRRKSQKNTREDICTYLIDKLDELLKYAKEQQPKFRKQAYMKETRIDSPDEKDPLTKTNRTSFL